MKKWFIILSASLFLAQSSGYAEESRRLLLPLPHARTVKTMVFSPGKQRLASGDQDGLIKIWSWPNRSVEMSLQPARGEESAIEWLAWVDDSILVAQGGDNRFRVYDVLTGAQLAGFEGEHRRCPALLPQRRLALMSPSSDDIPQVEIIDLNQGKLERTLPVPGIQAHEAYVRSLAASPDGQRLALGLESHKNNEPNRVIELDVQSGSQLRSQNLEGYAPDHLSYSPSGRRLAGYGWDIMVWSEDGAHSLKPDRAGLNGLTWSGEDELLYSISNDGATLHRLKVTDRQAAPGQKIEDAAMSAPVTLSPDGAPIFSSYWGKIFNGQTGAEVFKAPPVIPISSLAFHPSGRLLTGLRGGDVQVWDLTTGKPERKFPVGSDIKGLALSQDGKRLAVSIFGDNKVRIYDWKTARLQQTVELEQGFWSGYVMRFSPNGRLLCSTQTSNRSDELVLYDLATGERIRKKEVSYRFAFHPTQNKWAVVRSGGLAEIDLTSGDETIYKISNLRDCAYDPQGNLHAVAGMGAESQLLRMYPKATGRLDEAQVVRHFSGACMDQLVYSPRDRSWWLHANSGALYQVDDSGKDRLHLPDHTAGHTQCAWQVLPTDLLAVIGQDNSVEFWRGGQSAPEGKLVAFSGGQDWLITSANGFFDGTDEASRLVEWQVGRDRYRVDQFSRQGFRPGLLREFFRGAKVSKTSGPLTAISKPPQLEILYPEPGSRIENRETDVRVRLIDQGYGFSNPKVYVNGHAIAASSTRSESRDTYVFKARLQPGVNEIRATGFDANGQVESRGDRLRLTCVAEARRKPVLHILAVGVNQASGGRPLQFAEKDAQAFASGLKTSLYAETRLKVMCGKQATKSQIDAAFRDIESKAEAQDTVVTFFAGHGMAESAGYRFLLSGKNAELDSLTSSELAGYLESIPAHRQFVVLDTCHSAAASPDLAARFAISQQRLARGSGTFLLAACRSDQTAAEIPSLKHGLLTYSLLNGFGNKGANPNSQGQITVNSLIQFVSSEFPEVSRRHAQSQELYQFSNGSDFPLVQRGGKS